MSYYEDVRSDEWVILGSHRFTGDEIKKFAAKYDPQPRHLDEAAAAAGIFGGLCASGWHTTAVMMRLVAQYYARLQSQAIREGRSTIDVGPSPGYENLKWLKPVFAGDTITYRMAFKDKRISKSRPEWGLVFNEIIADNQHADQVFRMDGRSFFKRRDPTL